MKVEILTPEKNVFEGEARLVSLPGSDGSLGILNNHAPLITTLAEGNVKVEGTDGKVQEFHVKGGTVEVLNNRVIVLAE
ncbi:MAG: ATP synthase F1 subunit epsilon [Flavobacteriales bacterium]|nr:ATP synthase F1 subunit epsilon [Flavobacteriales bacterium]